MDSSRSRSGATPAEHSHACLDKRCRALLCLLARPHLQGQVGLSESHGPGRGGLVYTDRVVLADS